MHLGFYHLSKRMIRAGADINMRNQDGNTPFHALMLHLSSILLEGGTTNPKPPGKIDLRSFLKFVLSLPNLHLQLANRHRETGLDILLGALESGTPSSEARETFDLIEQLLNQKREAESKLMNRELPNHILNTYLPSLMKAKRCIQGTHFLQPKPWLEATSELSVPSSSMSLPSFSLSHILPSLCSSIPPSELPLRLREVYAKMIAPSLVDSFIRTAVLAVLGAPSYPSNLKQEKEEKEEEKEEIPSFLDLHIQSRNISASEHPFSISQATK